MADLCVELAAAAQGACRPSPQVIGSSAVDDCPLTSAQDARVKPVHDETESAELIFICVSTYSFGTPFRAAKNMGNPP